MSLMIRLCDVVIGVCRVICSILSFPYVLNEGDFICDKMIKCVFLWYTYVPLFDTRSMNMNLDLVGYSTFVMTIYV